MTEGLTDESASDHVPVLLQEVLTHLVAALQRLKAPKESLGSLSMRPLDAVATTES